MRIQTPMHIHTNPVNPDWHVEITRNGKTKKHTVSESRIRGAVDAVAYVMEAGIEYPVTITKIDAVGHEWSGTLSDGATFTAHS